MNHEVVTASTGEEALQRVEADGFQVILARPETTTESGLDLLGEILRRDANVAV